jgi:hypothetical protein
MALKASQAELMRASVGIAVPARHQLRRRARRRRVAPSRARELTTLIVAADPEREACDMSP